MTLSDQKNAAITGQAYAGRRRPSFPTPRMPRSIEYTAVSFALIVLFWLTIGATSGAYFTIKDDHEVMSLSSGETTATEKVSAEWNERGRIRPVHYAFRAAETRLLGANPGVWHAAVMALGVLTCLLLYVAAREIGADAVSALVFVVLATLAGPQSYVWIEIGLAETLATFLTAIAVLAFVRARKHWAWDVAGITAVALAGMTKESFALIVPTMMLLRGTLHRRFTGESWRQTLQRLRIQWLASALVFVVEVSLLVAVVLLRPDGGAATAELSLSSFNPASWKVSQLWIVGRLLPLGALIALVILWRRKAGAILRFYLEGLLILVAWVLPQIVLYGQAGMIKHYLVPAVLATSGIVAVHLTLLLRQRLWWIWFAGLVWLSFTLAGQMKETVASAAYFTADTVALRGMITWVADHVSPDRSVVLMGDPALNYEAFVSLRQHLKFAGVTSPVYQLPVLPRGGYNDNSSRGLADVINERYPEQPDPDRIGAIVVLSSHSTVKPRVEFNQAPPKWFTGADWLPILFAEEYFSFELPSFRSQRRGSAKYMLLVPKTGEAPPPKHVTMVADFESSETCVRFAHSGSTASGVAECRDGVFVMSTSDELHGNDGYAQIVPLASQTVVAESVRVRLWVSPDTCATIDVRSEGQWVSPHPLVRCAPTEGWEEVSLPVRGRIEGLAFGIKKHDSTTARPPYQLAVDWILIDPEANPIRQDGDRSMAMP